MPIYKMNGSKDGKQKYRVRINYQDAMGKDRQIDRVAYGSSEAKELERKLMVEIKSPDSSPAARMTLNALAIEYFKSMSSELRETSAQKSQSNIETYVLPYIGSASLSKLNAPILQNWKNIIDNIEIPKTAVNDTGHLSLRTKKNIYSSLRALLNWGVKIDYLPTNVLTKVGNFKSTVEIPRAKMDYYTADEFKQYIAAAKKYAENSPSLIDWDYYVFFAIAFYTGLRKGEIHALKWTDISENKYINVSRSITQKLKGRDAETPPKNSSSIRTLQMPVPLINILNEHKKRQGNDDNLRICGGTKSLRDTSLQNRNKKYANAAGLKTIRIHDFRHSHVSLLANEKINIQEISRRLGHANIEMTWNTYSHLYPREEERAVEILNEIK